MDFDNVIVHVCFYLFYSALYILAHQLVQYSLDVDQFTLKTVNSAFYCEYDNERKGNELGFKHPLR